MTIIGVVANVQQRPLNDGSFDPVVYVPLAGNPDWSINILVRGSTELGVVSSQVQDHTRARPGSAGLRRADDRRSPLVSTMGRRVFGSMFTIFAAIALTMASVGLYAVTAYAVAQRTRRSVCIALGARVRHVWWLATRRASIHVAAGLVVGLAGSIAVLRLLPLQITRNDGNQLTTLVVVTALLVFIAFVAC